MVELESGLHRGGYEGGPVNRKLGPGYLVAVGGPLVDRVGELGPEPMGVLRKAERVDGDASKGIGAEFECIHKIGVIYPSHSPSLLRWRAPVTPIRLDRAM